jgi:hypothetical protein
MVLEQVSEMRKSEGLDPQVLSTSTSSGLTHLLQLTDATPNDMFICGDRSSVTGESMRIPSPIQTPKELDERSE